MRVLIADDQPSVGHTVALLVNAAKHHVVKVGLYHGPAERCHGVPIHSYRRPATCIVFVSNRPVSELTDIGAVAILQKPAK